MLTEGIIGLNVLYFVSWIIGNFLSKNDRKKYRGIYSIAESIFFVAGSIFLILLFIWSFDIAPQKIGEDQCSKVNSSLNEVRTDSTDFMGTFICKDGEVFHYYYGSDEYVDKFGIRTDSEIHLKIERNN